ncbi:MAG: helix-turn-helix domain-containing protein [Polyangiaceae bacterium]
MVNVRNGCARFEAAMGVLARPWTGLIFAALEAGPLRFGALRDAVGDIGDRMLSLRLRELEQRGLVTRHVIEGPPVRVLYQLTAAGHGFREVADAMRKWGSVILRAGKEKGTEAVGTDGERSRRQA